MPLRDRAAAGLMVLIWGLNFAVMKVGLQDVPPLLLGALRFIFVAFPAVFILKRPNVPLRLFVPYGLTICFGQFAFVFSALYVGMPTGIASLVLQCQAFISLILAAIVFGDRIRASNLVGLAIAFAGLVVLMSASISGQGVPLLGFVFMLCAATSWATGNMFNKSIGKVDVLNLVAWAVLVPILPFLAASMLIEGVPQMVASLTNLHLTTLAAVAFLAWFASLIGYSIWGHLLASHPVWKVAPLTLLVPIFGMLTGWLMMGERLTLLQVTGSAIVLAGLIVNVFGASLLARLSAR